jgi:hypothetical protein
VGCARDEELVRDGAVSLELHEARKRRVPSASGAKYGQSIEF